MITLFFVQPITVIGLVKIVICLRITPWCSAVNAIGKRFHVYCEKVTLRMVIHIYLDEYTQVALQRCFISLHTIIKMGPFRGRSISYIPQSGMASYSKCVLTISGIMCVDHGLCTDHKWLIPKDILVPAPVKVWLLSRLSLSVNLDCRTRSMPKANSCM